MAMYKWKTEAEYSKKFNIPVTTCSYCGILIEADKPLFIHLPTSLVFCEEHEHVWYKPE